MADLFSPDWPAPANVRSLQTRRGGGVSQPPWDSFNLGDHVGDAPEDVARNRQLLCDLLPTAPCWLKQVHGVKVVDATIAPPGIEADASFCRQSGAVCVIMTADCLPVLFCDRAGTIVAAAHAGWRGLLDGVLEATVAAMQVAPGDIMAWLGPAIGPGNFEVGAEVRTAFVARSELAAAAFAEGGNGRFMADLGMLARQRLNSVGVSAIFGGGHCTVDGAAGFFSYRRDGVTGRMASLIWLV